MAIRHDGYLDIERSVGDAIFAILPDELREWAYNVMTEFEFRSILYYFSAWNLILCAISLSFGILGDHAVVSSIICSVVGGCLAWIHPKSVHVSYLKIYLGSRAAPIMDMIAHQAPMLLVIKRFNGIEIDLIRSHALICVYLIVMNHRIMRLYRVGWGYLMRVAVLYVIIMIIIMNRHPLWSLLLSRGMRCSA